MARDPTNPALVFLVVVVVIVLFFFKLKFLCNDMISTGRFSFYYADDALSM